MDFRKLHENFPCTSETMPQYSYTLQREFLPLSGIPRLEFAHKTKLKVSTSPWDLLFLQKSTIFLVSVFFYLERS